MSGRSKKMEQQLRKRKSSVGPADAAAAGGGGGSDSEGTIEPRSGSGGLDRSNLIGLLLGCVGAAMTLLAYQQTVVSTTQCMGGGLVVLMCALCIKEGFFSF